MHSWQGDLFAFNRTYARKVTTHVVYNVESLFISGPAIAPFIRTGVKSALAIVVFLLCSFANVFKSPSSRYDFGWAGWPVGFFHLDDFFIINHSSGRSGSTICSSRGG